MTDGMWRQRQIHKDEIYEICVSCRINTGVPKTLDIQERLYYIEGAGQMCRDCYDETYPETKRSSYDELD